MNTVGTEKNKNVFIASLPRSGSTLLGMILNQHQKCFNIGESFHWAKLNPQTTQCSCGTIGCETLINIYDLIHKDSDILNITKVVNTIDTKMISGTDLNNIINNKLKSACDGYDKLTTLYRDLINKDLIIDTSSNIIIAKELIKRKNWKCIVMLRDPRGIIHSLKKAAIRHGKKIPNDLWCPYLTNFIISLKKLDHNNVHIIKYEDLCNNTINTLKAVCEFLGISFNKKILRYRKNKGHFLMANRMRLGGEEKITEDLDWINHLTKNEKNLINNNMKLTTAYMSVGYNIKS